MINRREVRRENRDLLGVLILGDSEPYWEYKCKNKTELIPLLDFLQQIYTILDEEHITCNS